MPVNLPPATQNIVIKPLVETIARSIVYYANANMQATQNKLEQAAKGLLMMSESDNPFDYFETDATTINDNLALKLAGKPEGTLIETTTVDYLLRNLTDPSIGSVSAEDAQKFQNLANTMKQELKNIKVYRVGRVQVSVIIIGTTADGTLAGMKTLLIET